MTRAFAIWTGPDCETAGMVSGDWPAVIDSDLIEEDFFLRLLRLRAHHVVVQLVEPGEDDVLLVVERQGVLPVAVVGEAALAFLDLGLLLVHLLLEPVDHVLRALKLDGEVLVDVLVHQRVDREGGELRVERGERDIHEPAAGHGDHSRRGR